MKRPSEKALRLGEELFAYVPYGLTPVNAIQELAEMVDESNHALLEAVRAVLEDAERNGGLQAITSVAQLRQAFANYEPLVWSSPAQGEQAGIVAPTLVAKQNLTLGFAVAH